MILANSEDRGLAMKNWDDYLLKISSLQLKVIKISSNELIKGDH